MLTQTDLKERGWSKKLIDALLGDPDQTARNPVYPNKAPPMKLWERARVEAAEKHPDFLAYQTKRAKASARSKAVAQCKRQELLDKVNAIDIHIKRWQLPKLSRAAIWEWEQMGNERDEYFRNGAGADEATKNRWAVNYIRHNLVYSGQDLVLYPGQTGINEAEAVLEHRIYEEIAEVYPELFAEALHQAERLWGRVTAVGRIDAETLAVDLHEENASSTEWKRYRLHKQIERNTNLATRAKHIHGTKCQCCGFDFKLTYGDLGDGYIEVHHLKPLASLVEGESVQYDARTDFRVLCANCHRMIHRMDDPSDIKDLQQRVGAAKHE
jgi:hypothetical protein